MRATDIFRYGLKRRGADWSFRAVGILHSLLQLQELHSFDSDALIMSLRHSITADHSEIAFGVLACSCPSGTDSDVMDSVLNLLLPRRLKNMIQLRPAYHFDKIGSVKSPLRTVEILDWMVSELPSTAEVEVALDAVGALELDKYRTVWDLTIENDAEFLLPARRLGEAVIRRADRAASLAGAELSLSLRALVVMDARQRKLQSKDGLREHAASRLYACRRPKECDALSLYAAAVCTGLTAWTPEIAMIGEVGQHMMHWAAQGSQAPAVLSFTLDCLIAAIESRNQDDSEWLTVVRIPQYAGLVTGVLTEQQIRVVCTIVRDALVHAGVKLGQLDLVAHLPLNSLEVWSAALDASDLLGFVQADRDAIRRAHFVTLSRSRIDDIPATWDVVLQVLSIASGLPAGTVPGPRDAVLRATDLFCSGLEEQHGRWSFRAVKILHSQLQWNELQSSDSNVLFDSILDSLQWESHPEIADGMLACSSSSGSDSNITDSALNLLLPRELLIGGRPDRLQENAFAGSASIWQLIVASSSTGRLLRCATSLVVRLRLLQSIHYDSERVAMLLQAICGAGRAVAVVSHSRRDPDDAFEFARHIKDVSSDWWGEQSTSHSTETPAWQLGC